MPALVAGIHAAVTRAWMAGTSPAMTRQASKHCGKAESAPSSAPAGEGGGGGARHFNLHFVSGWSTPSVSSSLV
ncbi:MAG: hypothetical protein FJX45_14510 [Alphaproteobacteria bacterium]|nr:hypothetical protein [Alphaproteobacteria bacterium]MBM3651786.1 hypothetical protein [Alphaproteobacteria bacterium]